MVRHSIPIEARLQVAPMMEHTDRHFRFLCRALSKHVGLYTEMVTTGAALRGNPDRILDFDATEQPLALQLGGSNPVDLAKASVLARDFGYAEVNLNCGCPSDRVQSGRFGACLMAEPELVRDCVRAMADASGLPITVKTRIGIDDSDEFEFLRTFVETVAEGGCRHFVIHARKAWLKGLSPKENREKPPLRYETMGKLGEVFPGFHFVVNGGITTLEQAKIFLDTLPGVMIGREFYRDAWLLAQVDPVFHGEAAPLRSRADAVGIYADYAESRMRAGDPLTVLSRHVMGLFTGVKGGRMFRRVLGEGVARQGADAGVFHTALAAAVDAGYDPKSDEANSDLQPGEI